MDWVNAAQRKLPKGRRSLQADSKGRLHPDVALCHRQTQIYQSVYTSALAHPERERRDLWWFEEYGST